MNALMLGAVLLLASPPVQETRFALFNNCDRIGLGVELQDDDDATGLTEDRIQTAVESRLRGARIYDETSSSGYLDVFVHIHGRAVHIRTEYNKWLFDEISGESGIAPVWSHGSTGTHGGNDGFVLQAVAEHTDSFIVEYLRLNDASCQ